MILFFSTLLITATTSAPTIVWDAPFVIEPNETVSALYDAVRDQISYVTASRGISIIFGGKIILEFIDDHRILSDIGMNCTLNDIEIIQKPIFVAMLEMVCDVINIGNIPWFHRALDCLSDSSANQCQNVCHFGRGVDWDHNGNLIGVDLSRLNLTGTIHLESLPQSVRSLDLSFNDLDTLNLSALTGKSVKKLNVEHNPRCHINTAHFNEFPLESGTALSIRELQISSNQMFPWITDLNQKRERILHWLNNQLSVERIIVDGELLSREIRELSHSFHSRMLQVVNGVTNKEKIPWYSRFVKGTTIRLREWKNYRVHSHIRSHRNTVFRFNLSGLGLEGHVDLGFLLKNVVHIDLSDNKLQSISFVHDGNTNLRELNIQNNDDVRFAFADIGYFRRILRLSVSSNQLQCIEQFRGKSITSMTHLDFIPLWLSARFLREIEVDGITFQRRRFRRHLFESSHN